MIKGVGDGAEKSHNMRLVKSKQKSNSLTGFVRKECACYDNEYKQCLGIDAMNRPFDTDGGCNVINGNPCDYFEKTVLCSPDYKYQPHAFQENPSYEKRARKLYAKINPSFGAATGRRCGCGASLLPKKRYCARCAEKKRRGSGKKSQKKFRDKKTGST